MLDSCRSNMETQSSLLKISVTWRGKKFIVEMNLDATLKDLGQELQKLTNIQEDTMRVIVPKISGKTSKLLAPFSTEHADLSLKETSITEVLSFNFSISCALRFRNIIYMVVTC